MTRVLFPQENKGKGGKDEEKGRKNGKKQKKRLKFSKFFPKIF